jgi:flagellar FliJ protein
MKHNPMQTLTEMAQSRQDTALKQLAGLLTDCRTQEEKLALLEAYRRDYLARFTADRERGISPAALSNFEKFMKQLDAAIAAQGGNLANSQTRVTGGRERLQDAMRRLRSFETLLERRASETRRRESRRTQASEDEIAARAFPTPAK